MLNSKQVDQLFRQNVALFGDRDGVPEYRVAELVGKAVVDFSIELSRDWENHSEYGVGDYSARYLTY